MKKKLTVLIVCIGLLAGMSANAQSYKTVQDSNTVIYSDSISPNTVGVFFAVKKGGSIEDNESIYVLKNAVSDNAGKIDFEFNMPEEKNGELTDGEYDIYVKEANGEVKKSEMIFATLTSRNKFFESLKKVSSVNELRELLASSENEIIIKAIGGRADLYEDKVADEIYSSVQNFENVTQEEFAGTYNTAAALVGIENADEDEVSVFLELLEPEFGDVKYTDIKDEKLIKWLSSYFSDEKFSDDAYKTANILYKFNNAVSDKIDDLLEEYDKALGIEDNSVYRDYKKSSKKAKINVKISEMLEKNPATTVNKLLNAIDDATEAVEDTKKTVGGGGGGGGSSSKASGYVTGVPAAEQTDKKEEVTEKETFKDMNAASWAVPAVSAMAKAGIVNGDENGNFRPNSLVTREEFVKMLVLASGKYNKDAGCEFDDVPSDVWYYSYVASAFENGVANGVNENMFGAGQLLTRQDMAVLCVRAKGDLGAVREYSGFADDDAIAEYAKDAVKTLYMANAVNGMGDNKFVPGGQATRAECAQIIYNLFLK